MRSLFVAFFFAICLFAPGASAADDERAVQLFNQGRDAIVRNDFNKAYAALSEAWKLKQSYDIAALLGQSELQLGKYTAAAEHLSASLRAFPSTGDARKKKAA
ncbi:MAG: tetratricopeptide repeat protein, partial [Myxococcales bacterium]|nr:tetratricopeptide repeat protein [Myxococcales bacterium]